MKRPKKKTRKQKEQESRTQRDRELAEELNKMPIGREIKEGK